MYKFVRLDHTSSLTYFSARQETYCSTISKNIKSSPELFIQHLIWNKIIIIKEHTIPPFPRMM